MTVKLGLHLGQAVLVGSIVLSGCGSAPERPFADADLLIGQSVLPPGWALDQTGVIERITNSGGHTSGASVGFYATDTVYDARMIEYVYRYSSIGHAGRQYRRMENSRFDDQSFYRTTPWQPPAGFTFASALADQWRFACAGSSFTLGPSTGTHSTICLFQAQYDEFVVTLSVTMEVDGEAIISVPELNQLVAAIEQQVSQYLGPDSSR